MINDLRFKIFYLFIGLFVYLLIGSISAKAAPLSLSIDPSIIEIYALAPSTATSNLTIQNKSDSEVNLRIELRPFKPKFENGELEYLSQPSTEYAENLPIFKNLQILDNKTPIQSLILGPSQQKNLTLNVNIPQDTNISDYYFSIIFISQTTSSPTSNASLNQLGIATNVLLSVGAKDTPNAVLREFSTRAFFEKGPVSFTLKVENKGTHFIKPKGEILIKNMFGQNIAKLDILRVNILSDSARAIPSVSFMQDLRAIDESKIKADLDFRNPKILWKESFLLGFYTAKLTLSISDDSPIFTKSIHFFAFPFQGLILIVIIAIAVTIIRNRLKAYMKK